MTVQVAIVGLGRISTLHVEGYLALPADQVRIAAVCDSDHERAETLAMTLGRGCRAATFDAILADPAIDAVEILVPSFAQPRLALAALAARKHVTVQKPLAGDPAVGQAIVAAAEEAGVQLRVFENTVNAPAWRLAEELIAQGRIGRPLSIYLRWANSMLASGWEVSAEAWAWRLQGPWAEQFAAPSLFDDSAHLLSPAVALFGPIARVVALSGDHRLGSRATGFPYTIAWHHVGGGQAVVEGTLSEELEVITTEYSADTSLAITGSAGILWVNTGEGRVAERPTVELATGRTLTAFDADPAWRASWPIAQQDWIAALHGEGTFRWTGRQALDVLAGSFLIDDAVRAARA